jgi:hypothetical protein
VSEYPGDFSVTATYDEPVDTYCWIYDTSTATTNVIMSDDECHVVTQEIGLTLDNETMMCE